MRIEPKYYCIEGTPLRFLKFVQVTLVFGLILRLIQIIPLLASKADWYSITYNLLGLTLTILALLWLGDMKWKGVLAYCGLFFLIMLDGIAVLVLCAYYGAYENIGVPLGRVLATIIILVPLWVYFGKRRLLFDPAPKERTGQEKISANQYASHLPKGKSVKTVREDGKISQCISTECNQTDKNLVRFCRNCGCELVPDSKFCSICGTKVVKEW